MNADQPAYPSFNWISQDGKQNPSGLTKREEFAKAAMQGILSNNLPWDNIVKASVDYADALLAELAKEKKA